MLPADPGNPALGGTTQLLLLLRIPMPLVLLIYQCHPALLPPAVVLAIASVAVPGVLIYIQHSAVKSPTPVAKAAEFAAVVN